jgi:hypothetical protein
LTEQGSSRLSVEDIGDPSNQFRIVGVKNGSGGKAVRLREEGFWEDSLYWVSWEDFNKYFRVLSGTNGGYGNIRKYATGGLVDYTGPAWVDGTKSKPEAFLSAKDTELIGGLRDVLRVNPSLTKMDSTSIQKGGDSHYEIHINVDQLGDGYSVDDLMSELEERIVQVSGKNAVIKL